jgi:tetratricopeptide (TPR) repeat protein
MTTNGPDDETLAAFIYGRLERVVRRNVMEHIANCHSCYEVTSAAWDFEEGERESATAIARPDFRRRTLWMLAAAAALAGVMLFVPGVRDRLFSRGTGMQALARASASVDYRIIEPRLSGGFEYRPKPRTFRGAADDDAREKWQILRVASEAEKDVNRKATPERLQTYAASKLLLGDEDAAVRLLEQAARSSSGDATLWNDLSAAYYVRATRNDKASDYPNALAAADHARRLDPKSAEAAWNRALALEAIDPHLGAQAWGDYLKLDSTSKWAEEARQRLKAST